MGFKKPYFYNSSQRKHINPNFCENFIFAKIVGTSTTVSAVGFYSEKCQKEPS